MPVLKVKKDGVWEELGGTSPMDGGNADTLDGKHASEFALTSDVDVLHSKIGDNSVPEQISTAISGLASSNHSHTILNGVKEINNPSDRIQLTADSLDLFCNKVLLKSHPTNNSDDYSVATKKYVDDNRMIYSAGTGISLSGTTFSNSGVHSISTGSSNGTISVNTNGSSADIAVSGLGSAAYTSSASYATADQGVLASNAMPRSGGTFTGAVHLDSNNLNINNGNIDITDGQIRCRGSVRANSSIYVGSAELYHSTPFIDFHFGTTLDVDNPSKDPDYTTRIIESSQGALTVHGTLSQISDRRLKENIVPFGESAMIPLSLDDEPTDIHSELFDRLQPVQYNFINGNGKICFGLIAQDVLAAMSEVGIGEDELDLVHHNKWIEKNGEETELYSVSYSSLVSMLIYEVQKLKAEIKDLKEKIDES